MDIQMKGDMLFVKKLEYDTNKEEDTEERRR